MGPDFLKVGQEVDEKARDGGILGWPEIMDDWYQKIVHHWE